MFNVHRNHKMFTTKEEMVPAKRRKRPHLRRSRAIEGHCPKCHYCPRHQNKPPPKAFSHRAAFKLPITTSNQAFREYITYVSQFCIKCFYSIFTLTRLQLWHPFINEFYILSLRTVVNHQNIKSNSLL